MKKNKFLARSLLISALMCGGAYYFWQCPTGLHVQKTLQAENDTGRARIAAIQTEIATLDKTIMMLKDDPVATERVLREDLQMSYTNEYVYLLRKPADEVAK